jgi:hypothetical protein
MRDEARSIEPPVPSVHIEPHAAIGPHGSAAIGERFRVASSAVRETRDIGRTGTGAEEERMRSQDTERIIEKAPVPDGPAELVVHRIGPQTYTLTLRAGGKVLMVAADYFSGAEAVQEAIAWLKVSILDASVVWRDEG